jgi:hypothetical protein
MENNKMRLKELYNIPPNSAPPTVVLYDASDTHLVHHSQDIEVYVIDDTDNIIYCIFDDLNQPAVAYIALKKDPTIVEGDEYHQVVMMWVDPAQRGKSYALHLRQIICKILNIKIITDNAATSAGISNVKKVIATNLFHVSYYNKLTNQKVTEQPPDVFTNSPWQIMFENYLGTTDKKKLMEKYTSKRQSVIPMRYMFDDIE